MKYDIDNLINIHTYHQPDQNQIDRMQKIRDKAIEFAIVINDNAPDCADKSTALRKIREAQMVANAAIVLNGEV